MSARLADIRRQLATYAVDTVLDLAVSSFLCLNTGALGDVTFTLPPWSPQAFFRLQNDAPHAFTVVAQDGQIKFGAGRGVSLKTTNDGDAIILTATRPLDSGGGVWLVEHATGEWDLE